MKTPLKILAISSILIMTSCTANLLPKLVKDNPNSTELETKGKEIIQKAFVAHGVDNLLKHQVYQFTATDDWKGMMAGMGKIWPEKNTKLDFKYAVNTFDAQVKFLTGEQKGNSVGLQSWQYYTGDSKNANFEVEKDVRYSFGMAAFQYFTELVGRLSNAEIIRYGGEERFNDINYDLVYVTWKQEALDDSHDQYILYVNKTTNMVDYASYTLRDNYLKMPGSAMFYGTIGFSDFRDIDGYKVPFTQSVFLFGPEKKNSDYMHQLVLESFSFDGFDKEELYPNQSIKSVGDSKL